MRVEVDWVGQVSVVGRIGGTARLAAIEQHLGYRLGQRPSDAVPFNGSYFKVFSQQVTWSEAQAIAREQGGYLATIESAEESAFLHELHPRANRHAFGLLWVNDQWEWINGVPLEWTNWSHHQPGPPGVETVGIFWEDPPFWHDGGEHGPYAGFIVRWER